MPLIGTGAVLTPHLADFAEDSMGESDDSELIMPLPIHDENYLNYVTALIEEYAPGKKIVLNRSFL